MFRRYLDTTAISKARQVDTSALAVTSLLTWPEPDLAEDVVLPHGLSFAPHQAHPAVDVEHTGAIIGWARKSLSQPGSPYSVRFGLFDVNGTETRLPIGTTYFDPSDQLSSQCFTMIHTGALPGVSLEFVPDWKCAKSLGKRSPVDTYRDAYEFGRVDVVRWTHCHAPVCPNAQVVLKSMPKVPPELVKILRDGKVAGETLHPTIRKALSGVSLPPKTARVEKAMEEQDTIYDNPDSTPEMMPAEDTESESTPTAEAAYQLSQMLQDAHAMAEELLKKGEHVKGKKAINRVLDDIQSAIQDCLEIGKNVDEDVNGKMEAESEGESESEESEVEPSGDEEVNTETDDDGVLKCIPRHVVRKGLKRFTLKDLSAAVKKADAKPQDDPATIKRLQRLLEREERELLATHARYGG